MATAKQRAGGGAPAEMSGHKVTAPLVVAKMENGTVRHFGKGDVLPAEVSQESIDNLTDLGFLEDA